MAGLKETIWKILPAFIRNAWSRRKDEGKYGWYGDYPDWQSAVKDSGGYDAGAIREKVFAAALQVKEGKAFFERDGVLFQQAEYPVQTLAALQASANENNGVLEVLDFGGGPGSSYFLYSKLLRNVKQISWHVLEQAHFYEWGNKTLGNDSLRFFESPGQAMLELQPRVLLLSSVMHYIEDPQKILGELLNHGFDTIIIETTPFIDDKRAHITVQRVPPTIYKASYPCHLFTEKEFLSCFPGYKVMERYRSTAVDPRHVNGKRVEWLGFVLRKA